MKLRKWFSSVFNNRTISRVRQSPRPRRRLGVEALEDRSLPSGTPTMEIVGAASVDQGTLYVLTLGTVVDADPNHVVQQYTVHWGDNSSSTCTDASIGVNRTIAHRYLDAGTLNVSIDITENSAFTPDGSFLGVATKTVTVANIAPVASAQVFARTGKIITDDFYSVGGVAEDPRTGDVVLLASQGGVLRFTSDGTSASISEFVPYFNARAIAVDDLGRTIVGGANAVARYHPDGSLDGDFGNGGFATIAGFDVWDLALDAQGRIVVTGSTVDGDFTRIAVGRFTAAGQLDGSFGNGTGKVVNQIFTFGLGRSITEDPLTGNLVVAADTDVGGLLLRYTSNGTLDTTFGNGGALYGVGGSMDIDSAGRILIGFENHWMGNNAFSVVRYRSDGSLDSTFGTDGMATIELMSQPTLRGQFYGLAVDAQGRILMTGSTYDEFDILNLALVRLTATGDPDITFGDPGPGPTTTHAGFLATFAGSYVDPGQGADAPYSYAWTVTTDNGDVVPGVNGSMLEYTGAQPDANPAPVRVPDLNFTPIAEGHYTVTLTVADKHGAVSPVATVVLTVLDDDVDSDGIADSLDPAPATYSSNFTDDAISGTIVTRGDQLLAIVDATSSADGVMITASAAGGSTPATISVDGGAALFFINAGDQLIVTHGSVIVHVLAGAVEATFVSDSGEVATTTLPAGNELTFEPETFVFSAPATNTETVQIVVNGSEIEVGSGESVRSVQIDVVPGSTSNTLNLASNGVISVAIFSTAGFDARTVNVASLLFAGAHAAQSSFKDVNGDGILDLLVNFRTQETTLRLLYEQLVADDINEDGVLDSNHETARVAVTGSCLDGTAILGGDEMDLFLAGKALRDMLAALAGAGAI
jgi:uncharacterized delta-60 repeat protein